ncbi:MAG: hypothetical protein IK077_05320, partial [Thermoguttaceae bacterium]|nr:hypothetical protein [Thermoguttaceae bacterium]
SNGWRIRKNGNFLTDNPTLYRYVKLEDGGIVLRSERRTTDWREWFKILGRLEEKRRSDEANEYGIEFKRKPFDFSVGGDVERFDKPIEFHVAKVKGDRTFKSRLKMLVRRATFCVACRNCEANCPHGAISFVNGQVHISDACVHCYQCMTTDNDGCVRYQSLRKSKAYEDE